MGRDQYILSYFLKDIATALQATLVQGHGDASIDTLLYDSRRIYNPATSLFFALKGLRRNGHQFIEELYEKGIRNFVISDRIILKNFPEADFLLVSDTLEALQHLATWHRNKFKLPVIGITGSNGKTIVKEWLYQLLQEDQIIIRSPKSFNSQIGVPLSVWSISQEHQLGIFEAGISRPGEMNNLAKIIQPTIGILTNIGEAHSEGFTSLTEKAIEKMKLFSRCNILVFCRDNTGQFNPELSHFVSYQRDHVSFYHWSRNQSAWMNIRKVEKLHTGNTFVQGMNEGRPLQIEIPFSDDASIENAITCWCTMLALGYSNDVIAERMKQLTAVNMRLELKKGINGCTIINDSYSADVSSLEIALNFLAQNKTSEKKTAILSDFLQTSSPDKQLYSHILNSLQDHNVSRLIGIGERISNELAKYVPSSGLGIEIELYQDTNEFIRQFLSSHYNNETILIKGARVFEFEKIVQLLEQKAHQTVLEINLNAIVHNLKQYQQVLKQSTRVMAMVKAFAYGSGGAEIAGILQFHKVDYLGVAYADEGVELRKSGITLPIMVMNAERSGFELLVTQYLEPVVYSFDLLHELDRHLKQEGVQNYPVHIELETGMNRLGFAAADMDALIGFLNTTTSFRIQSIFTHLAASEDEKQDAFTEDQFLLFKKLTAELENGLGYPVLKHISNTAAIVRKPEMQLDMVRIGIGLYGVDPGRTGSVSLIPAATLKSTIAQIRRLKKGDTVSYNRRGQIKKDSIIATVRIGYADGFSRKLSNGAGKIWVRGKLAPVVGVVCMDMTMIDITDIPGVVEGDDVIIFGKELPIEDLASQAGTIPYEIMTSVSQRVKRVYFQE